MPLCRALREGLWEVRTNLPSRTTARVLICFHDETLYALRHTNIVRQLLAGVPVRIVAVNHDTSIAMIERTYSRYIGDHSDALARAALLDTTAPTADRVVPLHANR